MLFCKTTWRIYWEEIEYYRKRANENNRLYGTDSRRRFRDWGVTEKRRISVSPPHINSRGYVGFRDSISNIEHRFGFGLFNSGSVSLGEECRACRGEYLKGISGSGETGVMRIFINNIFHQSLHLIKWRRTRHTGRVAPHPGREKTFTPEEERALRRTTHISEDNIKIDHEGTVWWLDCVRMAEDSRIQWRTLLNKIMNFCLKFNTEI